MGLVTTMKERAKAALPSGSHTRTLPSGIGRGLRMGVDLRGGHLGLYFGLYEMELNRHLRRLCYLGAQSFDVGGQMGYDALVLAKLSRSRVLTVECMPEWCDTIRHNVASNPELPGPISILAAHVDETNSDDGERVTLDKLADDYFVPDFIKIDIEGAEVAALLGGERLLSGRKPGLLIEVHSESLERECLKTLIAHGYQPQIVDQRRFMRDYRPTAHNRWIVAVGDPSALR